MDRRYAFFTNSGDGTISVLSLKTLEVIATFTVGGILTAIVARGGEDHNDSCQHTNNGNQP
jgi:YVTN family beta-propeller protein